MTLYGRNGFFAIYQTAFLFNFIALYIKSWIVTLESIWIHAHPSCMLYAKYKAIDIQTETS